VNLLIGIVFVFSDFVVTVFPKVTAKLVGVWLKTDPSSSRLSTTRELKHGISKFRLRKTAVSPAQVASDIGNMSPEISENNPALLPPTRIVHTESSTVKPQVEAGCMGHNHDIVEQGSYPRDGEDKGCVHGPFMESFTVKPQVEAGCMDHNHDIVDQGFVRGPWLRGTKDQGRETQWNGNLKQNLDRSAVALPVEETMPVIRIANSSKARKITSILSSNGQSAWEKDDTFL
jgi:hypothetical protein